MKLVLLILFIFKVQIALAAEGAEIINFQDHARTCSRALRVVRPIRDREQSRDIIIHSLLNDPPISVRAPDFFSDDIDPSQIFIFQGQGSPMFGKIGIERWRPLSDTYLNFREEIYFLKREATEDGGFKFTQHTRFKFTDEGLAFVEVLEYFRTVTRTVGRGNGADFIDVFRTERIKPQLRALLQGWAVALDNRAVDHFIYGANQIIGDPKFDFAKHRLIRACFQKVVNLFKEGRVNSGREARLYEDMLVELERRRLLHYYLLL